jgi:hypothetical protein
MRQCRLMSLVEAAANVVGLLVAVTPSLSCYRFRRSW